MGKKHNIYIQRADLEWIGIDGVEFQFDAENKVLYMYGDRGAITYLNTELTLQICAQPVDE